MIIPQIVYLIVPLCFAQFLNVSMCISFLCSGFKPRAAMLRVSIKEVITLISGIF